MLREGAPWCIAMFTGSVAVCITAGGTIAASSRASRRPETGWRGEVITVIRVADGEVGEHRCQSDVPGPMQRPQTSAYQRLGEKCSS